MVRILIIFMLLSSTASAQVMKVIATSKKKAAGSATVTAQFNFNQTAQSISGYADVSGEPDEGVRTATQNGITVSSRSTSSTYWSEGGTGFTTSQNGGESTANPSFTFNASASDSYWYTNKTAVADGNEQLEVSGLTPLATYTITLFASRDDAAVADAQRQVRYVVKHNTGRTTSAVYNVKQNTSTTVVFTGVQANSSGIIYIGSYGDNSTYGTSIYGYFGILKIESE